MNKLKDTKVGIVTILKVNNYGAELQAYATQKIIQNMGYDAEIIDYLFYKNPHHIRTKLSAPTAKLPLKKVVLEKLYPILARWKSRKYRSAQQARNLKFEQFHIKHTKLSRCYYTFDALKRANLNYDVLLSGSDQVWNPGIYSSLDPYFLRFGTTQMRRVAYASSFGVSHVPSDVENYYREALLKYAAIGVREDTAVKLVNELSGKDAQLVLDPTLLLTHEQWLCVANHVKVPRKPYVLIYELGHVPYLKQVAKYISQQTGMSIVRICQNAAPVDIESNIQNVIDAGPAEFISLFDQAKYVVTNSFHGTAFSINFGKEFYTIIPKNKTNNSRQKSILKLMNCESRMLIEDSPFPQLELLNLKKIALRLQMERENSMCFLKQAIDGK